MNSVYEQIETWLDGLSRGRLSRRQVLSMIAASGLAAQVSPGVIAQAVAAGENQAKLRQSIAASYSYIVVGAGSAGCVVARRLAEKPGATVLLLEAGPSDEGVASIAEPSIWFTNIKSKYDWGYDVAPSPHTNNRQISMARGKVLGGCSSINALLWARGVPNDYDTWAYLGNYGWDWKSVLATYRKIEDWEGGASEWRGAGGPLHIELPKDPHPLASGLLDAARQLGMPVQADVNGGDLEGASYCNLTIKDGARHNTARAYLRPYMDRPNLTVLTGAHATRLLFKGDRCVGIDYALDGKAMKTMADQEIVLSGGSIDTPRLLTLSGLGNATDLRRLGIPVVANLPGVGQNLQDHPLLMGVTFETRAPVPPLRNNAGGSAIFWKSRPELSVPDLMPVVIQVPYASAEIRKQFDVPENAFSIAPGLVRVASRGHVKILSADPMGAIEIQPNYLAEQADVTALARGVELCLDLGSQAAYKDLIKRPASPNRKLNKQELVEFVRNSCSTYFHPVGTCAMGTHDMAVVDPELRVYGVQGLRIADASIMPVIPTCNTHAPTVMIGERAAAMI